MEMLLQNLVNGITMGCVYALMAVGLTIIFGVMDIPNFAHGQLYMLGGMFSFFAVSVGINFFAAVFLSALAVAILGIVFEKICFRPVRMQSPIVSMVVAAGLAFIIEDLSVFFWGPHGKLTITPYTNTVFEAFNIRVSTPRLIVVVWALILLVALYWFIKRTIMGKQMRAVAEDKEVASLIGVNLNSVFSVTFALGCGLAAVSGGLMSEVFAMSPTIGLMPTLKAFCIVVMAGMGNIGGAIYAGLLLGLMETFGEVYIVGGIRDLFAFALVVIVLLIRKQIQVRRKWVDSSH